MNRPSDSNGAVSNRVGVLFRLIDLRVADLDLIRGGWKNLLLEARGQSLRALLVRVLPDAFVEPRAKIRQRIGKPLDGLGFEGQQPGFGDRFDRGAARSAATSPK